MILVLEEIMVHVKLEQPQPQKLSDPLEIREHKANVYPQNQRLSTHCKYLFTNNEGNNI